MAAVVDRHSGLRDAGLNHRDCYPEGRPRLLGAGFEAQADLQWDRGNPKSVHSGRVAGQHGADHVSLGVVAQHPARMVHAVSARQDAEVESPRE